MAYDNGQMSPADVAAVVDNNRGGYGYGYPVMPYPMFAVMAMALVWTALGFGLFY